MTYTTKNGESLIAGRGVRIIARDDSGKPCGEYTGYWRPEHGDVVLYPAPGSWIYGRLEKHVVSDRCVRRGDVCHARR